MPTQYQSNKLMDCPALTAIRLISGKWKTRILWLLRTEPLHFGELKRNLAGVSAKMLTEHLRQLEKDGLIYRKESMQNNLLITSYGYTAYGETLIPVLDVLGSWGLKHTSRLS